MTEAGAGEAVARGRAADYPPFVQLGVSRFDQTTFYGRWRHFSDVIDPRVLFTSDKKLEQSIKLLNDFKSGNVPAGISNKDLWEAQKIKQSIIHPDTGKKVFMPFRMSGYVPFGSPIVVGLLLPNLTLGQAAFWQWLNQSHNACVNYANRNASKVLGCAGQVGNATPHYQCPQVADRPECLLTCSPKCYPFPGPCGSCRTDMGFITKCQVDKPLNPSLSCPHTC